jgi:hypothetical protein
MNPGWSICSNQIISFINFMFGNTKHSCRLLASLSGKFRRQFLTFSWCLVTILTAYNEREQQKSYLISVIRNILDRNVIWNDKYQFTNRLDKKIHPRESDDLKHDADWSSTKECLNTKIHSILIFTKFWRRLLKDNNIFAKICAYGLFYSILFRRASMILTFVEMS